MQGAPPSDEGVSRETAPAFVEAKGVGPIASFSPARIIRFSSPNWSAWRLGQSNGLTRRRPSRGAPIRSCATRLAFLQIPEPNLYERRRRCLRARNCRGPSLGRRCAALKSRTSALNRCRSSTPESGGHDLAKVGGTRR